MATVGEIAIVVGADVGPMVRELGKGKGALNDFGNSGSKMGAILGSAMGKAAIGVGVAATALVALTKSSMNNIDVLSKQARALGIAVSSFQAMAMVAARQVTARARRPAFLVFPIFLLPREKWRYGERHNVFHVEGGR